MATKKKAKAPVKTTAKKANGKSKTSVVLAMLKRPAGCTRVQALAATKWSALSFQQFAESQGVTLRADKKQRPFTYRVA
jgi:hypothetical protein